EPLHAERQMLVGDGLSERSGTAAGIASSVRDEDNASSRAVTRRSSRTSLLARACTASEHGQDANDEQGDARHRPPREGEGMPVTAPLYPQRTRASAGPLCETHRFHEEPATTPAQAPVVALLALMVACPTEARRSGGGLGRREAAGW